jgi:hypothetical protein
MADRQAVTSLVNRYRIVVAANDGPKGCALMYSVLAESVVEDNPQPAGSHNTTCGTILTILFKNSKRQKIFDVAKLHIMQVQIRRNEGLALMGRHGTVKHSLEVRRERGRWRIAEINGTGMA